MGQQLLSQTEQQMSCERRSCLTDFLVYHANFSITLHLLCFRYGVHLENVVIAHRLLFGHRFKVSCTVAGRQLRGLYANSQRLDRAASAAAPRILALFLNIGSSTWSLAQVVTWEGGLTDWDRAGGAGGGGEERGWRCCSSRNTHDIVETLGLLCVSSIYSRVTYNRLYTYTVA